MKLAFQLSVMIASALLIAGCTKCTQERPPEPPVMDTPAETPQETPAEGEMVPGSEAPAEEGMGTEGGEAGSGTESGTTDDGHGH